MTLHFQGIKKSVIATQPLLHHFCVLPYKISSHREVSHEAAIHMHGRRMELISYPSVYRISFEYGWQVYHIQTLGVKEI